ncbi:MAG TPA: polysaccharide biosynthesis C-terminal domain-containing protein, partial [Chondromyces sp.]|nr:polysaccharide biosynthesis C-terminal domain-containing protein [Chondromyces sp.]
LQALNLANAAMINSLIGAAVKLGVIFALARLPEFGIYGAALGIVCGMLLVTLLHLATVFKKLSITIYVRDYMKFIVVLGLTVSISYWAYHTFISSQTLPLALGGGILSTSALYIFTCLLFGLITKQDLARIPFIKKWIH